MLTQQQRWGAFPSLRKLPFHENISGSMVALVTMNQVLEAAEADIKAALAKQAVEYEERIEWSTAGE